ncbi:hypothetical protein FE257_000909 [Aspergillus nanangensis]|uniref:Major facilitator superfamily (MFS) profile domain-containing protein n=1 Tax=Aspergillus nanangensis TaxID=2582783 RepID=A0AAD4CER8_ASPNN|nr:hypothetical protein FE257_000909 [Aspergillus nanangensis]
MDRQPLLSSESQHTPCYEGIVRSSDLEHPSSQSQQVPRDGDQDEGGDGPKEDVVPSAKAVLIVAALTSTCFLVMLDMAILPTAIPQITTEFHSLGDIGWFGSAYLLASSTMQPLTGKLYLSFGLKASPRLWFTLYHILIHMTAYLSHFSWGVRDGLTALWFSTKQQVAHSWTGRRGSRGFWFTEWGAHDEAKQSNLALIGFMMLIGQLGMVGGPALGGFLVQYTGWRWCFYINLPIGAVSSLILSSLCIPDGFIRSTSRAKLAVFLSLDPIGFVLFTAFTVTLFITLQWGGSNYKWTSPVIVGLLCVSVLLLSMFSLWERSVVGENAMFPYSMLRRRVVWASCLTILLLQGCALIYLYYLPMYFQSVKGESPLSSGFYNSPGIGSQMLLAAVSGVLVGRMGYYLPWILASGVIGLVGSSLISTLTPETSPAAWISYQIIAGIGRGCGTTMPMVATQNILSPEQIPLGMSLIAFCQSFGGSMFLVFAQVIFNHSLVGGLKRFAPTVDIPSVIDAGAAGLRNVVQPEELPGVIKAYNLGITREFYLAAVAYIAMIFSAWGMGWHSVKRHG